MSYIKRDIENIISKITKEYACILIAGPRQVGKTTVLKQLMDPNREYVTLDDLDERRLAKMTLQCFCKCILSLFSSMKYNMPRNCFPILKSQLTAVPRQVTSGYLAPKL